MVHSFRRNSGPFHLAISGTQNLCAGACEVTVGTVLVEDTGTDGVENSLNDCGADNLDTVDTFFQFVAPEGRIYTGKISILKKSEKEKEKRKKKREKSIFF